MTKPFRIFVGWDIEAGALSYTENDAAATITGSLTVSDVDDVIIENATVQITGNYQIGQDLLAFTNLGPITGSWNAATGTMTLSGSDSVANYQAALRTVTYQNTSDNPSTLVRTVSFTVNDGDVSSTTVARAITVATKNQRCLRLKQCRPHHFQLNPTIL